MLRILDIFNLYREHYPFNLKCVFAYQSYWSHFKKVKKKVTVPVKVIPAVKAAFFTCTPHDLHVN